MKSEDESRVRGDVYLGTFITITLKNLIPQLETF